LRALKTVARVLQRIAADRRLAIASAVALMLFVAYVAFIAYAAITNGPMAGLGVFLTWPILLGALTIIVTPFWLAGRYAAPPLRRRWSARLAPAVAGGQDEPQTITTNTFPC
jgi:uncharacterized membrane protein (DUF485 family)